MQILFVLAAVGAVPSVPDAGPFVRLIWLIQEFGTPEAVHPKNDSKLKSILAKANSQGGTVHRDALGKWMQPENFEKIAGRDGSIDPGEASNALKTATPASRNALHPLLRSHADYLTTTFDRIDPAHQEAGARLANWIAANYRKGQPLNVIVVCTGNSRRSILGASMGNLAAAYCGMPEIRFHSGGTDPTAFNSRTVKALKSIGFEVEPTGKEAPRGEPDTKNPEYRVSWGEGFETHEFSKKYSDPANPQQGFAALMVCSEADEGCPFVKGASLRLSLPFLDPKTYDGGSFETAKYEERRDDIGRLMLSVMIQARAQMASNSASSK